MTRAAGDVTKGRLEELLVSALLAPRSRTTPAVLAYHHVGPPGEQRDRALTISGDRFAEQMDWLVGHGYRGLGASTWLDGVAGKGPLPSRPVVLTFDDGYADLAEHALPVLERRSFGATVFVVTGLLGASNEWDHASGRAHYSLLTMDAIREWAARGIEFGAHTRTHPRLVGLGSNDLEPEILGSRNDLAEILGRVPRTFAYPYGDADASATRLVSSLFEIAFTADEGRNGPGRSRHALRRTGVLEVDSSVDLALRLQLGWTPRHRVRQRIRRRLGRLRRRLLHSRR